MVDFSLVLKSGGVLRKSKMTPEQWALYYPRGAMQANDMIYRLLSDDVLDIIVHSDHADIRIVTNPEMGMSYRLFCHHNGLAIAGESNEYTGTTFGAIYPVFKFIQSVTFNVDGSIVPNTEACPGGVAEIVQV